MQVGDFQTDPTKIAGILETWLSPLFKHQFAAMGARARVRQTTATMCATLRATMPRTRATMHVYS